MALQLWCPFTLDTKQQGLGDISIPISASQGSIVTNGKLGKCLKTTATGNIETTYIPDLNNSNYSIGGWFKFNKSELQTALSNLDYTSIKTYAIGNLIGNNSFGGLGLCWNSNDMYASSRVFNRLDIFGCLRTSSAGVQNVGTIIVDFDVWMHIFLVFDKIHKTLSLYKNGSLIQSKTITDFSDGVSRKLYINYSAVTAGNGPGACIPFYMNDFRLYDHALSPREIEILSRGLVCHYPLSDSAVEPTTNLVTSITAGGRTTVNGDTVTTTGEDKDTYFFLNTSEKIINGQTYTLSCDVSGIASGEHWRFSFYSDPAIDLYNGHNEITFTAKKDSSNTQLILDDTYRPIINNPTTFSHFQLEKKDHATLYAGLGGTRSGETTVYDCSGYQYNGTVNGSLTVSSDTARYSASTYVPKAGYIQHPNALGSDNADQEWTCCAWVKLTGTDSSQNLNNFNLANIIRASTTPLLYINSSSHDYYIYGSVALSTDTWTHIAFVFKNSTGLRNIYINGELKNGYGPNKDSTPAGIPDTVTVFGGNFDGYVSDYREYATALSAAQIAELYNTAVSVANNGTLMGYELVEV